MKVLILVGSIPPKCGGAENVAWSHALTLNKHFNDEVHVLTFGENYKTERIEGIFVHFLPKRRLLTEYYLTIGRRRIWDIVNAIKPEVIHQHIPQFSGYVLRDYPCVKVATIHDGIKEDVILYNLSFYRRLQYLTIRRWLNFRKMDAITTVSKHNADYMSQRYNNKYNFVTIPNGIDVNVFRPLPSVKKENKILYVGRLLRRKGVHNLIEASKSFPEIKFTFIGKGNLADSIRGDNLEYLGFVDNLPEFYNSASMCVFPSNSENYPLVGLEAMACGIPVISTSIGFSEYINHKKNGIIVVNNKPETIVAAIRGLIDDKELKSKIISNGLKTVKENVWPNIVTKYRNLYLDIIKKKYING